MTKKISKYVAGIVFSAASFALAFMVTPALASASETATDGNGITWEYDVAESGSGIQIKLSDSGLPSTLRGKVTLPSTLNGEIVTELGNDAFYNNEDVTEVTFSSSITSVGSCAFQYCSNLKAITWDASLIESVGESAFSGCKKLESLTLPTNSNFTVIPDNMLYECEKISTLVIPAQIYKINSYAFSGSGVTNAVLPDTLTSLGANLFNDCDKLISIQLPSNSDITTIPEGLCKSCPALKSVNIPEGYDTISNSAFSYSALVGITLPSTITSIEDSAFYDCESMQFVQFTSPAVPSFSGESQFKYATSMFKVFCPAGTESLYQTSMADAANTLGLPEKTSFVGKSEKVTTIPVLSGEITVTGTLTVGTPISNLKLSGTFLNGLNNTPITGTLRWEQPNKSFPAGYASEELIWVFTPAASYGSGAMTLTGTYQYSSYISATSSGTNGNTTVVINKSGNQTSVTLSKPGRPAIKSVKKKGKKAITVKWKKAIYGATGYHIAISTKKNKSFKIKKTVAKWYSLSTIIKGLKKGKTYYIKVRAYKKVNGVRVTGNYSKVKKIKL